MKKKDRHKKPNRTKKTAPPPTLSEMQELSQNLEGARKARARLVEEIQKYPNDEAAKATLVELDDAIEFGKRRLSAMTANAFRQSLGDIEVQLTEDIKNVDEAELIQSIEDTEAAIHIRGFANALTDAAVAFRNLHPDDKPQEILDIFSNIITNARRQLAEKRAEAEKRFPHLRKVYEMDDNYKKALTDLLEFIKTRDEMAEAVKIAPLGKRAEGLRLLQQLDKQIEKGEQALAVEYEAFQTHARTVDDLRDHIKSASDAELQAIRQQLKDNPDKMIELQKLLAEEFPE